MSALLVDVADPGHDGDALAEALSEMGFEVRRLAPAELRDQPTAARLVVLAGDAPGALDVLDHLRRTPETATLPVLLMGAPADGPKDVGTLVGLGADGVYGRPAPVPRVVRKVQTFLTPSEQLSPSPEQPAAAEAPATEQTSPPSASDAPDSTLRLHSDADLWQHDSWVDGGQAPEEPGHGLSSRVLELVRAADRRLFPEAPELPLSIIDPGESIELLLGDDLRRPVPLPEEPAAEPPFPHERRTGTSAGDSFADATTVVARGTYRGPSTSDGPAAEGDRVVGLLASFLARDLPALVVAGARERYEFDDVFTHLDRTGRVRLFPEVGLWLETIGFEASLVDWLQEHDGEVIERWLEGGPPGGGAPGLLLALVALKAAKIQTVIYTGRVEARAKVAAAHALAEDGDYFSILGVPQDAGTAEIEAAHALRYRELAAMEGLDGNLAEKRRVALEALDEACEILAVGRLRSAYRDALERG